MVTLKDGSLIPEPAYTICYGIIRRTWNSATLANMLAMRELVKKCRDSSYQFPDKKTMEMKALTATGLLEANNTIADEYRRVILNCFVGEMRDLLLVVPLQESLPV